MTVDQIDYGRHFLSQYKKLSPEIQDRAIKCEKLFRENPLHPSLRLHQLKGKLQGYWSISVTSNYRIVFYRVSDGTILFVSIGKHDLYKAL